MAMPTSPRPIADPARRRRVVVAVALILLVSAGLRLWQLGTPPDYMFDEVYYAKDAKAIVDGRIGPKAPLRWEAGDEVSWPHPEMGKFAIAAGIVLFGDRSFGWRLPAVVAGLVLLACVYPLARRLGLSPGWSLIALLLAAADPLGITQSRIATLDIFVAVWTVLCILFALRYAQDGWRTRWALACGAAGGMALATKWSGALALMATALIMLFAWLGERRAARKTGEQAAGERAASLAGADSDRPADATPGAHQSAVPALGQRWPAVFTALILLPALLYLLSYVQYFSSGHSLSDWWELHRQMVQFNTHLEATHSYASLAPTWIVDYRPVWYYFDGQDIYRGVIAIGNPFLWWLATLTLVAAPVLYLWRRSTALLPAAALVVVLYVPWFMTTRTSFLYYMTPVAPFLAILVAAGLCRFAGGIEVPRRGWLVAEVAAVATALLWQPIGRLGGWLFWDLPRGAGAGFGWVGLAIGIVLALAAVVVIALPRFRAQRRWVVMLAAGAIVGIAVAFIPIVLALPISPEYFSRITWFPSWV